MYTKDLFAYSMTFEKKVMSSLRSNSDINDIESAYNQEAKNKIDETNEDFSNLPHPLPLHQTTFKNKNVTNAKTLIVHFTGKKGQEKQKAHINLKKKFIPAKTIKIKKTATTVSSLDVRKRYLRKYRSLISNSFDHSTVMGSVPPSLQSLHNMRLNTNKDK